LRVLKILAQGPHSRLYLAEDEQGARVAVKEILFSQVPEVARIEAFEREAQLLGQLNHPQLPRLLRTFREGSGVHLRLYLVQQFMPGETLEARLRTHRYSEEEVLDVARSLLRILVYLHGRSPPVLHRDIKPANVIVREGGGLALVDFGSARDLPRGKTYRATAVGTFGYVAPEQLAGTVDARSDLYAVGVTLTHLLTRKPPEGLVGAGAELEVEPHLKNASGRTRQFLEKLTARDPERRFSSAQEALRFLEPERREPIWRSVALVLFGAVLGAALMALLWSPPRPEPVQVVVVERPAVQPPAVQPVVKPVIVEPVVVERPIVHRERPAFDWAYHNEERHKWGAIDLRRAMEHTDIILANSIMDGYMLDILSGWRIGDDKTIAALNLLQQARTHSDFLHVRAACLVKAGDLFAQLGERARAEEAYRSVLEMRRDEVSSYRALAESRLRALESL
jgi:serine/threonine-protein kinase